MAGSRHLQVFAIMLGLMCSCVQKTEAECGQYCQPTIFIDTITPAYTGEQHYGIIKTLSMDTYIVAYRNRGGFACYSEMLSVVIKRLCKVTVGKLG